MAVAKTPLYHFEELVAAVGLVMMNRMIPDRDNPDYK